MDEDELIIWQCPYCGSTQINLPEKQFYEFCFCRKSGCYFDADIVQWINVDVLKTKAKRWNVEELLKK